jgi:putative ABC transport system permease protein
VASWQAASLRIGLSVCIGFVVLSAVLNLLGSALTRMTRPLANSSWFPLRQAVLHLARPGNQTRVVLLTVGLGTFFIMGVRGLQVNLLDQFALQIGDQAPDLFLIDIQQDQAPALQQFLAERLRDTQPKLIPVLRARVTARGGTLDDMEDLKGRGLLSREYTITYRGHLEPNETVMAGRFPAKGEVSVEDGIRQRFGIRMGDLVRFDILGRVVDARVTSVRKVNWRDGRNGGFMFVFGPGTFDDAPHYYIAPVRVTGADTAARASLEHDIVSRFPNVSVIDLRDLLQTVRNVFDVVSVAINVVGTLVVLTGAMILIGAVAVTKFQRVYEAAIFKTLGASSRSIGALLLIEYGLLGTLAGAVGSFGALVLGWGVSRYALDIPWQPAVAENFISTLVTSILIAVVGVAASADVLRQKPLATLRAE